MRRARSAGSRWAIATPSNASTIYKLPRDGTQMRHVPGAPIGTRGGIVGRAHLPGRRRLRLQDAAAQRPDRRPVRHARCRVSRSKCRSTASARRCCHDQPHDEGIGRQRPGPADGSDCTCSAGPQRVSAAFIQRADGPVDDLVAPIEHTLADTNIGETFGVTALAAPARVRGHRTAAGSPASPTRPAGGGSSPAVRRRRQRRPTCATEIIRRLGTQAYRGVAAR